MSLDNVELTFDAAICIRVVDAQKAVLMLTTGRNDIISELYANVQARGVPARRSGSLPLASPHLHPASLHTGRLA